VKEAPPGVAIVRASWWGTGVFTASAVAAVAVSGPLRSVAVAVATVLFLAGCVVFAIAYLRAVSRSRTEAVAVSNLFFLTGGTAPPAVKRSLLWSLGVQVAVALATAIARPYTSLAFGTLVPVYGLALCGLWAARHGTFDPRPPG
jgi:hypothetical protein